MQRVPLVTIFMLTGGENMKLVSEGLKAYERLDLRVTTDRLNRWIRAMIQHHPHLIVKEKILNIKFCNSSKVSTTYSCIVFDQAVRSSWIIAVVLKIRPRKDFDISDVPCRLLMRGNKGNLFEKVYFSGVSTHLVIIKITLWSVLRTLLFYSPASKWAVGRSVSYK